MISIKFLGTSVSSKDCEYFPLPKGSVAFHIKHWERKIFLSSVISFLTSSLFYIYKRYLQNDGIFPFNRYFIIFGCLLGLFLLIVHEVLHLLPYPDQSVGVIGIERPSLFAICSTPISRNTFIFSAVLPSLLLGVYPLVILCLMPVSMGKINTLLWTAGSVGLTTSCQDYVVALYAIFHIPHHAMVQYSRDGLNYFEMK